MLKEIYVNDPSSNGNNVNTKLKLKDEPVFWDERNPIAELKDVKELLNSKGKPLIIERGSIVLPSQGIFYNNDPSINPRTNPEKLIQIKTLNGVKIEESIQLNESIRKEMNDIQRRYDTAIHWEEHFPSYFDNTYVIMTGRDQYPTTYITTMIIQDPSSGIWKFVSHAAEYPRSDAPTLNSDRVQRALDAETFSKDLTTAADFSRTVAGTTFDTIVPIRRPGNRKRRDANVTSQSYEVLNDKTLKATKILSFEDKAASSHFNGNQLGKILQLADPKPDHEFTNENNTRQPTLTDMGDRWLNHTNSNGNLMLFYTLIKKRFTSSHCKATQPKNIPLAITAIESDFYASSCVDRFNDMLLSLSLKCGIPTVVRQMLIDTDLKSITKEVAKRYHKNRVESIPSFLIEHLVLKNKNIIIARSSSKQFNKLYETVLNFGQTFEKKLLDEEDERCNRILRTPKAFVETNSSRKVSMDFIHSI